MAKRIVVAGLLGGLALFIWEFVAHMALPLGEAGVKALPNEQAVTAYLKNNVKEDGFYFFPAPEERPGMTAQEKQQAMAKAEASMSAGPVGIMVIHPNGAPALTPGQLATQFAADVGSMLLAAFLIAQLPATSFGQRLLFAVLLSIVPGLRAHIPLWNWFGFPVAYTASQITVDVVGFIAGGLVIAKLAAPGRPKSMAAAS